MKACPSCGSTYASDAEFCGLDGQRLVEHAKDPLLGQVIMKYRLEELIGTGAVGCVYRATDMETKQEHAIKLLYGEMACDKRAVERFRREAEASSRIRHPNIVDISDFGTAPSGLTYMVMELLHGRTLDVAMEKDGRFPPERAARVVAQLALGLSEAHRMGYVHRDLKPGNVMLVPQGALEQVKILDFGIVRALRAPETDQRLTRPGYVVGTPQYMAPEQIDQSTIGPQTDVYALGCTLHEMLTGAPPFVGSVENVLARKLTRDPTPLPPETGELGKLALRLLSRNPEERPPSALHVTAELHRLNLLTEEGATLLQPAPWNLPTDVLPRAAQTERAPMVPNIPVHDLLEGLHLPRLSLAMAPQGMAALDADTATDLSKAQVEGALDKGPLLRAAAALGASSPGMLARPAQVVDLRTLSGSTALRLPEPPRSRTRWELALALGLAFGVVLGTMVYLAKRPGSEATLPARAGDLPRPSPDPERESARVDDGSRTADDGSKLESTSAKTEPTKPRKKSRRWRKSR